MNSIFGDLTLLYVEDEIGAREHLMFYFENCFKDIIVAKDGKEGVELYKKNSSKIDLIIADIYMPKMNGLQMISEIKKSNLINFNTPIILTTAYNNQKFLLEAIELGVFSYVIKPINIKILFKKIEFALDTITKERNKSILIDKMKSTLDLTELDTKKFIKNIDDILLDVNTKTTLLYGGFIYNYENKSLKRDDLIIDINSQEIKLIEYLLKFQNQIIDYDSIMNELSSNSTIDILRTVIKSLRKKTDKKLICNLSKVGYKIVTIDKP